MSGTKCVIRGFAPARRRQPMVDRRVLRRPDGAAALLQNFVGGIPAAATLSGDAECGLRISRSVTALHRQTYM